MKNKRFLLEVLTSSVMALGLAGCGSGGGGGGEAAPAPPPTPAPPAAPSSVQGFWSGALDASNSASAVILDSGDAWIVFQANVGGVNTTTGFSRSALTVTGNTYAGSGSNYRLADNSVQTFSASGTILGSTNLQATFVTGSQAPVGPVSLTYDRSYLTPASAADAAGRWRSTFNSGASVLTLDVAAGGGLSGSSTTGCSYAGSLVPRAGGVAVFDLVLNETCLSGTSNLTGIGTINAAKTSLFLAFTNADRSKGGLVVAGR